MLNHCWLEHHQHAEQTAAAAAEDINCCTKFLKSFSIVFIFPLLLACFSNNTKYVKILKLNSCANFISTGNRGLKGG